jgi:hypothetical protein
LYSLLFFSSTGTNITAKHTFCSKHVKQLLHVLCCACSVSYRCAFCVSRQHSLEAALCGTGRTDLQVGAPDSSVLPCARKRK